MTGELPDGRNGLVAPTNGDDAAVETAIVAAENAAVRDAIMDALPNAGSVTIEVGAGAAQEALEGADGDESAEGTVVGEEETVDPEAIVDETTDDESTVAESDEDDQAEPPAENTGEGDANAEVPVTTGPTGLSEPSSGEYMRQRNADRAASGGV